MKRKIAIATLCVALTFCASRASAQRIVRLSLDDAIEMANDSSLQAFSAQNRYMSGYWAYRTYKAERLPSMTLNLRPLTYYKFFTTRYDSNLDRDIYRSQRTLSSGGGLTISQNFDPLGGSFYLETDIDYMRSFGFSKATQFNATPIRLGYTQNLLGYNAFKWDRRIEPLKYERAKRELLYNMEATSELAVAYSFALALAQSEYKLAQENKASTDTLYSIGQMRYKIAAISQAELLTLRLDNINASNTLNNAEIEVKRAMQALAVFLNLERNTQIETELPYIPRKVSISADKAIAMAQANNPTYLAQKQNVLEAEQNVRKTRVESRLSASLRASVGLNQVADRLGEAYKNLLDQELVTLTLSIPIVDWGIRRGKYNVARNNLEVARIQERQEAVSLEEDLMTTLYDFDVQQNLLSVAQNAVELSEIAYRQTQQRFVIGKADVNAVTLAHNRQQEAQQNYIKAQLNYWAGYYKIRRLTLFDFESGFSL